MRKLSVAVMLFLTSIATADPPAATNSPAAISSTNFNSGAFSETLRGYVPDDKYKLRIGDRIGFQILEHRDLPKTLTVTDSGDLGLPYLERAGPRQTL